MVTVWNSFKDGHMEPYKQMYVNKFKEDLYSGYGLDTESVWEWNKQSIVDCIEKDDFLLFITDDKHMLPLYGSFSNNKTSPKSRNLIGGPMASKRPSRVHTNPLQLY